ncbi:MAG: hypothetical protein KBA18_11280 [Kiritimatiellae bacterium]|nr:hypothetical protein [Kiritimatiellia bacterium]
MNNLSRTCDVFLLGVSLLAIFGAVAVWAEPPETVNVHGALADPDGLPLSGARAYVVRFFDAETEGSQLGGDMTGMADVSDEGLFNIPVVLPAEALAAAAVWYALGIDTDTPPDADAGDDIFPERVRVHSVPFALEAGDVAHLDADRIGAGTVDNTEFGHLSGVTQPIQTALDAKADDADLTAHEDDANNPHAVTAAQVGLGNVDNTPDAEKPVSTPMQAALDAKADGADLTAHEGDADNPHAVTAAQVGLGSVDNTADLDKPVSTTMQAALDAKADGADLTAHEGDAGNPHAVTAAQVGLGNVNNTSDADKPVSTATQAALDMKLPRTSEAYVVVEAASDAATNGTKLLEAYAAAKALTPFGAALSATNRAVVLVPPGKYNLGGTPLTIDTDYVDLVGVSTARDDQYIYRADNVLVQTASDVRIENLLVYYSSTTGSVHAYYPNATWDDGVSHTGSPPATRIRNCEFRASLNGMRIGVEYAGVYEDCVSGSQAFGGGSGGTASGTFIHCTGGNTSFGGYGTASGTFIHCTGGTYAFGGYYGTASGKFIDCTGENYTFGGWHGTAIGTFTDCTGGNNAFGGNSGAASGTFNNCIGGSSAFGGYGTASGTFNNCTGGEYAFGGYAGTSTGGSFHGCRMTGTYGVSTFRGSMEDCRWGGGLTCGAEARIYRSTILGNVDLDGTAAGIAHSAVQGTIQNAGAASFNTGNLEDADVN